MQFSESLFTHTIMDNNIVRMSQEKMVNTILADIQNSARDIWNCLRDSAQSKWFLWLIMFYKWKCCQIYANCLRAEAESLWENNGKAINVFDTLSGSQFTVNICWKLHTNTLVLHLFVRQHSNIDACENKSFIWWTEKENQRHYSIHHLFDPLWEKP